MSEQTAIIVGAIIGLIGIILIALVSGLLTWMFAIVARINKLEERVVGLSQLLRGVPKRSSDRNGESE